MNDITRHYRRRQIERVEHPKTEYTPTIKIVNQGKETNFIDITFAELEKIKDILTK